MGKKTTEEFKKQAREKHIGKYDYSKANYVNNKTKVCIICSKHGEFWQTPNSHLNGSGCPKCKGDKLRENKTLTKKKFIEKTRKVHGNKYDYSNVKYVNNETKICIICPEHDHGEFWQTPSNHLSGKGCPKCKANKTRERCVSTKEEFVKKACEAHNDKYDYSKVKYVSAKIKVCIICPKHDHGEFWQTPSSHLSGNGCPKCKVDKNREMYASNKEEFVKKACEAHNDKYDYSNVDYMNAHTKVCIKCPEHGDFCQTPDNHLKGYGCSKCNLSHLERDVMNYLDEVGITYDYQKRFDWLGRQSLDFYLPDYNVGIECQGGQHFFPIDFAGKGVEWACKQFNKLISRDKKKKALCEKHEVKLLYYGNTPNYDTFLGETVHNDVQYLINYLNNDK